MATDSESVRLLGEGCFIDPTRPPRQGGKRYLRNAGPAGFGAAPEKLINDNWKLIKGRVSSEIPQLNPKPLAAEINQSKRRAISAFSAPFPALCRVQVSSYCY